MKLADDMSNLAGVGVSVSSSATCCRLRFLDAVAAWERYVGPTSMRYLAGQRWNYRTRERDVGSKLTILRVETLPELGDVAFISVDGLHVVDEEAPDGIRTNIRFTELTASALDESVTSIDSHGSVPDHHEIYERWRRAFDRGEAGVYREPVASIVGKFQGIWATRQINVRLATLADIPFLRELHHRAYRDVVVRQFGSWDEQKQDTWFEKGLLEAEFSIIEDAGPAVGAVAVKEFPDHLFLAELQILPQHQGRGLGSGALKAQLDRARQLQKPIRLRVLFENRARSLYERHGFVIHGQTETHYLMEWKSGVQS